MQTPSTSKSNQRLNLALFGLLCVIVLGGIVVYALYSRDRLKQVKPDAQQAQPLEPTPEQLESVRKKPYLLFRETALGPTYGRLTLVSLSKPEGTRFATDLLCDRVYATADTGVCLQATRDVLTTFNIATFDREFHIVNTSPLSGSPSRARVTRDGRRAVSTVFMAGHGYAGADFATRTVIHDLGTGKELAELEQFSVLKDGEVFKANDFNFWGVTFADGGDRFYATLMSGQKFYLVEGSVEQRQVSVIRDGVECPSLSPEGGRIAFKSRQIEGGRLRWGLHVMDLNSRAETIVNESRSVDDQAEWLDADRLIYAMPRNVAGSGSSDIWVARADGTGTPELFVRDAISPCVVRP